MKTPKLVLTVALSVFSFTAIMAQSHNHDHSKMEKKQESVKKTAYQCPMKCEGDKTYDKAGSCPKCGMDLKAQKVEKATTAAYQCPMKCEGDKTYDKAGSCPKCGMDLKAQKTEKKDTKKTEDAHKGHHH